MSNNQNILFLFIAITTLAITWIALKVPAVEGQVIFDNSSQSLIVDPFGPDQVTPPPALLAPDPTKVLSNEEVTIPLVQPVPQATYTPKVLVTPSNFNPPFEVCQTDQVQQVASVAVYKLKGKADLNQLSNEVSSEGGLRELKIQLDITLRPAADFIDINDIIESTMKYGNGQVGLTFDNQSFKTQCMNNAGSPTLNYTTLSLQQKVQNNPPFRECSTLTAPTVHAVYTIIFSNKNIDRVFEVDQGKQEVEITMTNNLVSATEPTGEITVGGETTDLGTFEVNSICEMTAT